MKIVRQRGGIGFDFSFLIFERIIILLGVFYIQAIFILWMPVFGSILAIIVFGIGFKTFVDVMRGIQLITEMQLEEGRMISIDDMKGIIYKLGWTGIFVTAADSIQFMTYGQLAKKRIRFHQANIPIVKHLHVKANQDNLSLMKQEEILNNQLFAHPLLAAQHKPVIKHVDGGLEVQLGVTDQSHLESFVTQLELAEFDVTVIE